MPVITRTTSTFPVVEAPVIIASGSLGTLRTLDLRTKDGATLLVRMGRRAATALSLSAYVAIRRSDNNTTIIPDTRYDVPSQIAACNATTLNGATTIGATTITVASATGYAVGQVICISDSGAAAVEFARVFSITGSTLTLERPLRVAHANGDAVTNLADVVEVNLPAGDIYEIRCCNNSGQPIVFAVDAICDEGATVT